MRTLLTLCLLIVPPVERPKKELPELPKATEVKEGWYICVGQTASGKEYQSIVTIRQVKEVYIINWIDEQNIVSGIGVLDKDKLCIGYSQLDDKQLVRGIQILEIKGDVLQGKWATHPGNGELHPEKWTFLRPFPKANIDPDTED